MLQIIKAHPNWHVHADVFEHPIPNMVEHGSCRHNCAMERGLVVGFCGQPLYCN